MSLGEQALRQVHACLCMFMTQHRCGGQWTTCRSQSSPSPCRSWGLNSGRQAWQQAPLPAKPSLQPPRMGFLIGQSVSVVTRKEGTEQQSWLPDANLTQTTTTPRMARWTSVVWNLWTENQEGKNHMLTGSPSLLLGTVSSGQVLQYKRADQNPCGF